VTPRDSGWDVAPSSLALRSGEVAVWAFDVACPAEELSDEGILAPDERARADRFHFERDRSRFIRVRVGLRTLLGGYLGIQPADIAFEYGIHGKPALAGGHQSPLKFNVSHSDGVALMAISHGVEVGVDVEAIRPMADANQIAARFFSPRETAELQALPAVSFFTCWTRKEAYLKARGDGLAQQLRAFSVTISPGATPVIVDDEGGEGVNWSIHDLPPLAGYAAALVTRGSPRFVRYHKGTAGKTARGDTGQSAERPVITRIL
jgi:4'-phosphopantetheinyl transferase